MQEVMLEFTTKIEQQMQAAMFWADNETEELLYGGGKGGGKSFLGCSLIFGDALTYPETHYFIARKELNDLRKFTTPTIHEVFQKWGLKLEDFAKYNGQDNYFELYNKSRVYLIACNHVPSDPLFERFGSMQMTRGMIEEGGEVAEAAKANLKLTIGRWKNEQYKLKGKLLITANPKKGWMKRDFIDPFRQGTLPKNRKYVQALAIHNVYLPEDYVRSLSEERDPVRRQRLFLGSWDYDDSSDAIVSHDALIDSFTNFITNTNEKYLVVDVARFGRDYTTFNYWHGLDLIKVEKKHKQSTEETKEQLRNILMIEQIPRSQVLVDEDGIGGAVVDGLPGVRGFVANSSPLPTRTEIRKKEGQLDKNEFIPKANFTNLKSQCGFKLAEMMNEHNVVFSVQGEKIREEIIEDLSALLKYKDPDSDGKLQLKPKDLVKEELGRSPDIGDAIIMRMWFELQKDAVLVDPNNEKIMSKQREMLVNRSRERRSTR